MRLFLLLFLFSSNNIFSQELTAENLEILKSLPADIQEKVINETNINLEPSTLTVVENSIKLLISGAITNAVIAPRML